jgi:hypothetical protein
VCPCACACSSPFAAASLLAPLPPPPSSSLPYMILQKYLEYSQNKNLHAVVLKI